MNRAVILPADGATTIQIPGDGTVLDRLIAQIRAAGCEDVTVLARPGDKPAVAADVRESADATADLEILAELAGEGHLFLAYGDVVASQTTVAAVFSDASRRSGVLVGVDDAAAAPVAVERGLMTGPGPGPWRLGGVAKVSGAHLRRLRRHWPEAAETGALEAVVSALHGRAVPVNAYRTPGIAVRRAADAAEAAKTIAEIDAVDPDAWRLEHAVKHDDDLFATYAVSSWSRKLVVAAARLGVAPTPITWISIVLAAGAAALFALGSDPVLGSGAVAFRPWYAVAAVLMYCSFVLDCVDGQLARYTQNFSKFGGWLDMMADRTKEYAIYAGLAAGAVAAGAPAPAAWGVATAALITQTVRHNADTWYAELLDTAVVRQARRRETAPPAGRAAHLGQRLGAASEQVMGAHRSFLYWVKRTIVAGVGDRWIVLAVCAVALGARTALTVLLCWQLFALAYTSAGRLLRSLAVRTPALRRADRAAHRDDGPLAFLMPPNRNRFANLPFAATAVAVAAAAAAVWRAAVGDPAWAVLLLAGVAVVAALASARSDHDGILDWLVPAGLRAVELGVVTAAGITADVPWPVVFALLAVVALYFYDLAAGLDKAASPVSRRELGLGWPARCVLVIGSAALAQFAGPVAATAVFAVLTVYIAAVFAGAVLVGSRAPKRNPLNSKA